MSDRVMSGAELKVQLTGLGLPLVWLADQLGVDKRTILRWYDLDVVPARAVAEIDRVAAITSEEMNAVLRSMSRDGVLRTRRTDQDGQGVANCNALPASWHRALTFRVLEYVRAHNIQASVAYGTGQAERTQ